uniref:Thrombospondin type-1 domain-containing protein 7B n=1 Tax=Cacopsylla melanoneura TaxID=428564 RepID=A0A8D8QUS7_9HEMI
MYVPFLLIWALAGVSAHIPLEDNPNYVWIAGPWEPCIPKSSSNDYCGYGVKSRKIECIDSRYPKIELKKELCGLSGIPEVNRLCYIPCEAEKIDWGPGGWSPCIAKPGTSKGFRHRELKCVTVKTTERYQYRNMRREVCDGLIEPVTTEKCEITDKQDCVVTEFSEWSECCDNAQHRTRSVLVAPSLYGKACPQLSELRKCDSKGISCKTQKSETNILSVGPWSKCERFEQEGVHMMWTSNDLSDNYYKHWPQVGYQKRTLSCYNSSGFDLDLSECMESKKGPLASRSCIMSQDCVVTPWPGWKVVKEGCIDELGKNWPTVSVRTREVSKLHEGSGKQCPHLRETKEEPSRVKCTDLYKWQTSIWSKCKLPKGLSQELCGGGLQFRNVTCISTQTRWPVDEEDCHLTPVPRVERCEVPCERDCSVGLWSPWGPCLPAKACPVSDSEPMPSKGFRRRSRQVIEAPSENGLECPATDEIQVCNNPECYHWYADVWSSCILDPGVGKCGNGVRSRKIMCKDHGGETVADYHCTKLKPIAQENCLIPCPNDCVVSAWSDWTACSSQCFDGKLTPFKTRNRTVIAPPSPGGHHCPPKSEMTQIESCNTHDCHKFSWLTLPWQPCNATCGKGIQVREVWCMEDNEMKLPDGRCQLLPKPPEWRPCTKHCPEPCVYSEWTKWSSCQNLKKCTKTEETEILFTRREREILSGENCTEQLEESAPCKEISGKCPEYNWALGSWSQCQMGPDRTCGSGLRARDIWCSADGSSTHVEIKYCIKTQSKVPPSIERCHVDCAKPCTVTDWSHWSPCNQPCSGIRSRTRQLIDQSSAHLACRDYALLEVAQCPCSSYYSKPVSKWSECLTNGTTGLCGIGTRYRAVGCFDENNEMVDPGLCGGSLGLDEEPCFVECPVDCAYSEWTPWSECTALCGPGVQNRTRKIIRQPQNGGQECDQTIQWKPCGETCEYFEWRATGWTECKLTEPALQGHLLGCGNGQQYRSVMCIDMRTEQAVDNKYCDWATQPSDINNCHVACPGDCVLSSWSEWSSCLGDCSNTQQRTRSLLRSPSIHGAPCPHAIQTQACRVNLTCFTYKWAVTKYSSCLPLGGSPCGEGKSYGLIFCERSDGRLVDFDFCKDLPVPYAASKWCYIDCPVDCELSNWDDWNEADCTCNSTVGINRLGHIKTQPSVGGRKCPKQVKQWKPCPAVPCYEWQTTDWSACQLHGATCGFGLTYRNVTCVRGDNKKPVEHWQCPSISKPISSDTCNVPCETDCQLSEWSHWSHCHGDCKKDKVGYQTRSRAVIRQPKLGTAKTCPEPLWETKDCDLGPCLTFDWVVTGEGSIVCKRSDGLTVVGGCDRIKRPTKSGCQVIDGRCVCTAEPGVIVEDISCQYPEVTYKYDPSGNLNMWFFAMIGTGTVFIIFVVTSVYLVCADRHDPNEVYCKMQSSSYLTSVSK